MKISGFTGTEPFCKTTRVKPAVIFRLCSNRSVPALLNLAFCIACFLGGGRSILLSYVDRSFYRLVPPFLGDFDIFQFFARRAIYLPLRSATNLCYLNRFQGFSDSF